MFCILDVWYKSKYLKSLLLIFHIHILLKLLKYTIARLLLAKQHSLKQNILQTTFSSHFYSYRMTCDLGIPKLQTKRKNTKYCNNKQTWQALFITNRNEGVLKIKICLSFYSLEYCSGKLNKQKIEQNLYLNEEEKFLQKKVFIITTTKSIPKKFMNVICFPHPTISFQGEILSGSVEQVKYFKLSVLKNLSPNNNFSC